MNSNIQGRKPFKEKSIRVMLENSGYLMWIKDGQGRFRFVNNKFLEFFCLDKEEVIGSENKVVFQECNNISIDDEEFFVNRFYEYNEKKIIVNNSVKWIEVYTWPLYEDGEKKDWVGGIGNDITEEKLVDDFIYDTSFSSIDRKDFSKLLENLNMYEDKITNSLFNSSKCRKMAYIFMKRELLEDIRVELNNRITNEKYMKLLLDIATDFYGVLDIDKEKKQFRIRDMYNKKMNNDEIINIIKNLDYTNNIAKIVGEINGKTVKSRLCYIKDKYNEDRFIEFRWYVINDKQVILTAKDKTIEKQLSDYNKELQKNIGLENMKSQYFANLSHEFKTPMNIIISTCQLIKSSHINDRKSFDKYISAMKQNSYRLSRLINNLIDARKIKSGYYNLNRGNYNIVSIIKDLAASMKEYVLSKERKFLLESSWDEIMVFCDPEMIERIMMNLISNAVKYTNKDNYIKINIDRDDNNVVITVSNNGVKLDKESAEIIFNRFVRADNVFSRRCEGSGIGLYIVKSLVKLHGGNIWVDVSEEGKTKFIFSIPIKNSNIESSDKNEVSSNILGKEERCNIEFSDIY